MFRRQPSRRATPATRLQKPAALRPGSHPGGGVRRTRPVKRASAGLSPVRAGAALALLVSIGGLYGAVSSDAFAARTTVVSGTTWTSRQAVLDALGVPAGQNVFTIRTADLAARIDQLPAVEHAQVTVSLPDEVRVAVAEREALLAWRVAGRTFLVDRDGVLFDEPAADALAGSRLPVVTDARGASSGFAVGARLDPVTLDAALRLGSLVPADVGSGGSGLEIRVDDTDGFVVRGEPAGWTAVFGFYTPTLRTTELIPGQVRLLRTRILATGEGNVLQVILADDHSGTLIPRRTPAPSPSAKP